MPDATDLTKAIKKAALEAQESTKPVNVCFGTVETAKPLTINVEQKLVLNENQLILTRNVTDYMTTVTVQWDTEKGVLNSDGKTTAQPPHHHGVEGKKNFLMHNALEVGDEVILIRQQEGQKFIVIDRIGGKS